MRHFYCPFLAFSHLRFFLRGPGSSLTGVTVLCPLAKHLSLLSTGSTQEAPSWHNWNIVDWDVKNQIKQKQNTWVLAIISVKRLEKEFEWKMLNHFKNVFNSLLLVSSADNLCKQFGPRSGPTICRAWTESKLFNTLIVLLKVYFEKISRRQKNMKNFPGGKEVRFP